MKRHPLRWTPLIAGVLYLVLAIVFAFDAVDDTTVDVRWIPALTLTGLGLAVVVGSVRSRPRRSRDDGTITTVGEDSNADVAVETS